MIQNYIFDLDDTLIDSSIYSRMYKSIIDGLLEQKGLNEIELQGVITKLKEESGKDKVDTYDLCKRLSSSELYYRVLERYVRHTYSLKTKEIPPLFKKIKQEKKRIGIVSGSQERTTKIFLDRFGLSEYVDFIESGDKSTVLFWITLSKKHDLMKEYTMVIDNMPDILETAKHAGYKTLHVDHLDNLEQFSV